MIILAVVAAFLAVGGVAFANDGTNASDKAVQTIWKFPDGKPWPWMPLQQVTVSTGGGPGLRLVCRGNDPQLALDLYRSISLAAGSAVVVRMSAKQGQNTQLFWGGDGFCEADSIRQPLIADEKLHEYIFRAPRDLKISRLRFDPVDAPGEVLVESITVPTAPFADVTVRNLYWDDAPLRASRPEQVTLVIRNLGWLADTGSVTLSASDGLRLRTKGRQEYSLLPDGFQEFRWTVEADGPVAAEVEVSLACDAGPATRHKLAGRFTRPVSLTRASYVPPPEPVKTDCLVGVQYFPGWKEGTHFGWSCIAPFPERKPLLGWYDENDPEVTDWEIKWALEHGISFFKYCWYRGREQVGRPVKVEQLHLGHAIHEGLFHARYRDKIRFCIMWENQNGGGVSSLDDLLKNLLPFWLENYFKHPSYLKLDNRPVLFVFNSEQLVRELGGSPEKVRAALSAVRQACVQAGFDGLWFVGNGLSPKRAQDLGLDGTFNYNQTLPPLASNEGVQIGSVSRGWNSTWERRDTSVSWMRSIVPGWWRWPPPSEQGQLSPSAFKDACRRAKEQMSRLPEKSLSRRLFLLGTWNEWGEGHYIAPHRQYGFGHLDAVREVFTDAPAEHVDVTPRDVGLGPYDKLYRTACQ